MRVPMLLQVNFHVGRSQGRQITHSLSRLEEGHAASSPQPLRGLWCH
jgi:hypothetical protein